MPKQNHKESDGERNQPEDPETPRYSDSLTVRVKIEKLGAKYCLHGQHGLSASTFAPHNNSKKKKLFGKEERQLTEIVDMGKKANVTNAMVAMELLSVCMIRLPS